MEFHLVFYFLIILVLTILFAVLKIVKRSRSTLEQSQKLPRGPPKLPLIGNLHQLASKATLPHRRLAELARVYGPIMHLQLGEIPTIVVSSADVAREVMKTHDAVLCNRPTLLVGQELGYNSTNLGFAPYGEYWRQVRKISTLELFTLKRVDSFRTIREEETAKLVDDLVSKAGSEVNLSSKLSHLTSDISYREVLHEEVHKDKEACLALIPEVSKAASGFFVADLFPSLKWLHAMTGIKKRMQKLVKEANRILDPIIQEHKYSNNKREGNNYEENLVDVLMKFHQDHVTQPADFSLTTNNIKALVMDLYGAGSETSSTLLEWVMSELIKNPRVMKKAQDEVRIVYRSQRVVNETNLDELKYLKLVIKETLRLHPPVTLLVPRESMERCQIQGYEIPSKTRVFINAWAIGRESKYWFEPEKFTPERFEDSSVDYKGFDFEFIPFGAGRRKCPGITLGIANVVLTVAKLLYHFDWKLPSSIKQPENLDMDESFGLTTRRKNNLIVIPIPYSS